MNHTLRLFVFGLLTFLFAGLVSAESAAESTLPPKDLIEARLVTARPRGAHYVDRLAIFLRQAPEWVPGGTVFLGDSITEGFPLAEAFPGGHVINQGIGGDKIAGVRARIDVAALAQPSAVYLMIGTNDVAWKETATSTTLAQEYAGLLDDLRHALPEARIVVQSALPTGRTYAAGNPRVRDLNTQVQGLAKERGMEFVNLYPLLQGADGYLDPRYTTDGIHLTLGGYWRWLRAIRTDAEMLESAKGLANRWVRTGGTERAATKVDPPIKTGFGGDRGTNELIVYTPKYGEPNTGTNPWGTEVIVQGGVVTASSPYNSAIPADGFVISGHGDSAQWIAMNLRPGVGVALDKGLLRIEPPKKPTLLDRLDALEGKIIQKLASTPDDRELGTAFLHVQKLRKLDPNSPELASQLALKGVVAK